MRAALLFALLPSAAGAVGSWSATARIARIARASSGAVLSRDSYDATARLRSPTQAGSRVTLDVAREHGLDLRLAVARSAGAGHAVSAENRLDPRWGWRGDLRTDDFDFAWRHEAELTSSRVELDAGRRLLATPRSRLVVGGAAWRASSTLALTSDDESPGTRAASVGRLRIEDGAWGVGGYARWSGTVARKRGFTLEVEADALLGGRVTRHRSALSNGGVTERFSGELVRPSWRAGVALAPSWRRGRWEVGGDVRLSVDDGPDATRGVPSRNERSRFARTGSGVSRELGIGFSLTWRASSPRRQRGMS